MKNEWSLEFSSTLAAPRAEVWKAVSTMEGVNSELTPWLRMTYPKKYRGGSIADAPLGQVLFRSVILLFGFLPIDLHFLRLIRIDLGSGFLEESHSISQRLWRHERSLGDLPDGGCTLTDRLLFCPRVAWLGPMLARFIRFLFENRHRRLKILFGDRSPGNGSF